MTQDELNDIIDSHQLWLRSRREFGAQAMLVGADLRLLSLPRRDLSEAVLTGANLERTDLAGTVFAGADLRGANLAFADLQRASLVEANLTGARFEGADLTGANLTGAQLGGADFDFATLKHADLAGVVATGGRFNRADLTLSVLDDAKLAKARMVSANLTQASLSDTLFDEADLRGAIFTGAMMDNSAFRKADLRGAIFVGVDLDRAILTDARLDADRGEAAGMDPDEDAGEAEADPRRPAQAPRSAVGGSAQAAETLALMRLQQQQDTLREQLRTLRQEEAHDAVRAGLDPEEARKLEAQDAVQRQVRALGADQRLLRRQIQRTETYAQILRAETEARVEAVLGSLGTALSAAGRRRGALRARGALIRGVGLIFLLAALASMLVFVGAWPGGPVTTGESGARLFWLLGAVALAGTGLCLLWLDQRKDADLRLLQTRQERLESAISLISAAPHLSFEESANLERVAEEFEAVRTSLLPPSMADERSTRDSGPA